MWGVSPKGGEPSSHIQWMNLTASLRNISGFCPCALLHQYQRWPHVAATRSSRASIGSNLSCVVVGLGFMCGCDNTEKLKKFPMEWRFYKLGLAMIFAFVSFISIGFPFLYPPLFLWSIRDNLFGTQTKMVMSCLDLWNQLVGVEHWPNCLGCDHGGFGFELIKVMARMKVYEIIPLVVHVGMLDLKNTRCIGFYWMRCLVPQPCPCKLDLSHPTWCNHDRCLLLMWMVSINKHCQF